jgi:hypothetical protein
MSCGARVLEGETLADGCVDRPRFRSTTRSPWRLLDHVMRRCIEKDRERRWQSIGDVTGELRWIVANPMAVPAVAPPPAGLSRLWKGALAFALLGAMALIFAGVRAFREPATAAALPALRLEISTSPTDDPTVALSPDGTQIAFRREPGPGAGTVGSLARCRREPRARRNPGRQLSVLVAGRAHDRLLRGTTS